MRLVGLFMRVYSYLFHLALALVMIALGAIAWLSGQPLNINVLPWNGAALTYWLFFGGLGGALITLLAIWGRLPVLFVLWAVVVPVMLVRGFFFSSYTFGATSTSISTALWFISAALLAFLGSLFTMRRGEPSLGRKTALA